MGIKRYRDFDAWQLAQAFKLAVFELVRGSEEAKRDALSSIGEAEEQVDDGIEMGYFARSNCVEALRLAKRCTAALSRLRDVQLRYAEQQRDARTPPRRQARKRRTSTPSAPPTSPHPPRWPRTS